MGTFLSFSMVQLSSKTDWMTLITLFEGYFMCLSLSRTSSENTYFFSGVSIVLVDFTS